MATYWLTFRIERRTLGGRDDDDRREGLYDAIRELAGPTWWREPTSFVLFTSDYSIDEIAISIKGVVAETFDIVLIRDAETKNARIIGPVDTDVFGLMPYLKQA